MDKNDPRVPDMRNREALLVHIEGLQVTITKRNAEIERLRAQIADGAESAAAKAAVRRAFKAGWQECSARLMEATSQASSALTTINRAAWAEYLKGETKEQGDGN